MNAVAFVRRVAVRPEGGAPWLPFVVTALLSTLTLGALTGALDLWSLRVLGRAVPIDHHRVHGLAQSFGFVGLFTVGVSLHLAPRLFGAELPSLARVRALQVSSIGGVVLTIVGRFGPLVPASAELGLLGSALLAVALTSWAHWVWRLWRETRGVHGPLHHFLLAGALWFALGGVTLLAWHLGQRWGGPLVHVPLEAVYAPVLFGGAASWLLGVFLRAGLSTLRLPAASRQTQLALFGTWQVAVATVVTARWLSCTALDSAASLLLFFAVAVGAWALRPWRGPSASDGTLRPRSVQLGLAFAALFGALELWNALGVVVWTPPLLRDASRHAFTLGCVTMLITGFAGRMVPGFLGHALRWPRVYDLGVMTLALSAAARMLELAATRATQSLAGASGGFAFNGMTLISAALFKSLQAQHGRVH